MNNEYRSGDSIDICQKIAQFERSGFRPEMIVARQDAEVFRTYNSNEALRRFKQELRESPPRKKIEMIIRW